MKKTLLAMALSGLALPVLAQSAPPAPEPDHSFSANVGLFTDYRFRGASQSNKKSALQGGFDWSHKSGFYAGNWNSSLGSTWGIGVEHDFYAGYKTEISGVGLDIGNLFYWYPEASPSDTNEVYIGLSYGPVSFKSSYTTTKKYFGTDGTGTVYYDLSASVPVTESVAIKAHYGYTSGAKGMKAATGTDYLLGVAVDLGDGWSLGASYIGTGGKYKTASAELGFASDATAVFSISRSF